MIKGSREINLNSFSLMFIAYFLLFSTTLCAQIASETNSYRRGDKVEQQQVTYMSLEENGQHAVWNLSGMEPIFYLRGLRIINSKNINPS